MILSQMPKVKKKLHIYIYIYVLKSQCCQWEAALTCYKDLSNPIIRKNEA